ncbi:MAG: peptide chain release factor N(5)-glutamine methyltransferase [Paludibacter sp.]|nr:peptide chain release factor N(5)-glutamine methyltransferase [Paludibacter sp.]
MNDLKQYLSVHLKGKYSAAEITVLKSMILEKLTSLPLTEILRDENFHLTDSQFADFKQIVKSLQGNKPIQYIFEKAYFYGMEFIVNQQVLIPRPETEELVEWILKENKTAKILDIGTGSGCIAVTLAAKNRDLQLCALDFSKEALKVAQQNAEIYNVNISFLENDILQIPHFEQKWDIIVSNPPYISENEKFTMQKSVVDFEPHAALFVNEEKPLIFYEKILQFAKNQLVPNGKIYFEIHKNFGNQMESLLQQFGFKNIVLKKDISGNDRMIKGEMQE